MIQLLNHRKVDFNIKFILSLDIILLLFNGGHPLLKLLVQFKKTFFELEHLLLIFDKGVLNLNQAANLTLYFRDNSLIHPLSIEGSASFPTLGLLALFSGALGGWVAG